MNSSSRLFGKTQRNVCRPFVTASYQPSVFIWLCLCLFLITVMVMIGGYTRLSGSGLSITEWKLIHGVIPPIGQTEWQEEFDAYKQIPQYSAVNAGMTLDEFQDIYWPEYLHRVLGRVMGLVFMVPFIFFMSMRAFSPYFAGRLVMIFCLGGMQGALGWYMVKSGLVDRAYVSPLRLSAHLGLAFIIFALLLWAALDVKRPWPERLTLLPDSALRGFKLVTLLMFIQVILGALMAGTHAGQLYNTFPTMDGKLVPNGLFAEPIWWHNLVENVATIQFLHRWNAALLVAAFFFWCWRNVRHNLHPNLQMIIVLTAAVMIAQFLFGVLTLVYQVPLGLALKHQVVGLVLFGLMIITLHGIAWSTKIYHEQG